MPLLRGRSDQLELTMVELPAAPTPELDEDGGDSVGEITLDDLVNQAVTNLQENPQALASLVDVAESKGVDRDVISMVVPQAVQVKEAMEQREEQQQQRSGDTETMDDPLAEVDADVAKDVIDMAIDMHPQGEEATLGGLKTLISNSPELIENAKSMHGGADGGD